MFALFFSLYYSMFTGSWTYYSNPNWIYQLIKNGVNGLGIFITSIFGDNTTYTGFADNILGSNLEGLYGIVALVLATITSIGIVIMAVKGVKKAFGIFFGLIR